VIVSLWLCQASHHHLTPSPPEHSYSFPLVVFLAGLTFAVVAPLILPLTLLVCACVVIDARVCGGSPSLRTSLIEHTDVSWLSLDTHTHTQYFLLAYTVWTNQLLYVYQPTSHTGASQVGPAVCHGSGHVSVRPPWRRHPSSRPEG
jgi:hypothetical protein